MLCTLKKEYRTYLDMSHRIVQWLSHSSVARRGEVPQVDFCSAVANLPQSVASGVVGPVLSGCLLDLGNPVVHIWLVGHRMNCDI